MIAGAIACAVAVAVTATSSVARIIGPDDRRPVSVEERPLYRAVGVIAVIHESRVNGGTGTLVNDQFTVLTAFHNVYHDGNTGPVGELQTPVERVFFLVGDRLRHERKAYRVTSIRPFTRRYGIVLPDEDDLALLTLAEPVRGVQPLSLQPLTPDQDGLGLGEVTHIGFHRDKHAGMEKMIQECRFRERLSATSYPRSPNVLVHDCDSGGNASGSPFLDQSNRIVAVHLGGSPRKPRIPGGPFNPRNNFNVARKVTPEVRRFVDGINKDPS